MDLGRVGIWTHYLDLLPKREACAAVAELEELGYRSVWIPETVTRDPLIAAALFLESTDHIVVATGIANIWGRDAEAMASGHRTLSEAFPGRFVLGLGVSHQPLVEGVRGHAYAQPLTAMRTYLEAMDRAIVLVPEPAEPPVRVLAALRPKMLELSGTAAEGAHPFHMPPEHTLRARASLGEGPLLVPEQAVVLDADPTSARATARSLLTHHLGLTNYENAWRWLGFDDDDFVDGGSDRLVDALVAWGDIDAILARIKDHLDAGADHVAVQVGCAGLADDQRPLWRELAPALTGT